MFTATASETSCLVAHMEDGAEETPGPSSDAQSTVFLLPEDSASDLQTVPLDGEQPPGPDDPAAVTDPNKKIRCCCGRNTNGPPQCNRCEIYSMITFMTLSLIGAMAGFCLLLYLIYLFKSHEKGLQVITDRLDEESDILRQLMANRRNAGYNPPEM